MNPEQVLQQMCALNGCTVEQLMRATGKTRQQLLDSIVASAKAQQESQRDHAQAQYWAQRSQQEINNRPRQKYGCIVATDMQGAFAKDGKIPWTYTEDLQWFKAHTTGHICVMGRATYDDLNERMGDKGETSVLINRRVFVVTSTPLPRNNATAVSCIGDIDILLTEDDLTKIVWFCGGEQIYREGIAKSDVLYITAVNQNVTGDRFFPTKYALKHFVVDKEFKKETAPDLHFTIWKRK